MAEAIDDVDTLCMAFADPDVVIRKLLPGEPCARGWRNVQVHDGRECFSCKIKIKATVNQLWTRVGSIQNISLFLYFLDPN